MVDQMVVPLRALAGVAVDALRWRQGGQLHVAVVAKATLALVADGAMTLMQPEPVLRADEHHGGSPAQSLRRPSELVPWRRRVDVTANGFACTIHNEPLPATTVRLAIFRGSQPLLDKNLYIYGDRESQGTQAGPPQPFTRMPLWYERAHADDSNPTGVPPDQHANIHDPDRPGGAAGFGPISRYAKARRALLGSADRKAVEGQQVEEEAVAELPDGFDGEYFQAAPRDQQLAQLAGDEWIVLDGFDGDHQRIASQLPAIRAEALLLATEASAAQAAGLDAAWRYRPLRLAIDALHVDGEHGRVTVTWRGSFAVTDVAALAALRVVAGVALGDAHIAWPEPTLLADDSAPSEASAAEASAAEARAGEAPEDHTRSLGGTVDTALPFRAAPWGDGVSKPVPQIVGSGEVVYADQSGMTMTLSPADRAALVAQDPTLPFASDGTRSLAAMPATAGEGVGEVAGDDTADHAGDEAAADVLPAARFFHRLERREEPPAETPPESAAPTLPKRTTEAIPIEKLTPLEIAYVAWQHRPPRDSLTIIVKGTFDLVPGGAARLRDEVEPLTGDIERSTDGSLTYPSDFAYFKPRADVLLVGHAYAPRNDEGRDRRGVATQARLRFGHGDAIVDRRVAVFGERQWQKALLTLAPTEPAPFEKMPLIYERAFGGPDWGPNPVGVGMGAEPGADGLARLPNLEDPEALIDSPGDVPAPVCFGPVHPLWGARWRGLGSYDARWLRERWPYFPDDFDWAHFQCAPPAQRLEAIRGDEPFVLTGVHPDHTHLEGRLAGITPRCFMAVQGDAAGAPGADVAFEPVVLRLDTVLFDTDAMRIDCVWRGIVETSAAHAPEIQALFLLHDTGDTTTTAEEAYARLLAHLATEPVADLPVAEVAPANDAHADGEDEGASNESDGSGEEAALNRQLDALLAKAAAATSGLADAPAPPAPKRLDPAVLAAGMRGAGASDEDVERVLAALRPEEADAGDEDEADAASDRERAQALLAAGEPFDGQHFEGADLSDLDFSGCSFVGCDLRSANLQRAVLTGANLSQALLDMADMTGTNLAQATLTHASLVGAQLADACFDEAELSEADLSEASGERASFRGARGQSCRLTEGCWNDAVFDGAQLPGLHLDASQFERASFRGTALREAFLFDAQGAAAILLGADLTDALCDGLSAEGARFGDVDARDSVWEGAELRGASFLGANLTAASFVNAGLEAVDMSAVEMKEARMKRARAKDARFVKSNLAEAQLEAADLTRADFTGANLYACETWQAKLDGAVLTDAIVAMSKLEDR